MFMSLFCAKVLMKYQEYCFKYLKSHKIFSLPVSQNAQKKMIKKCITAARAVYFLFTADNHTNMKKAFKKKGSDQ